jgi:hypothetical protein
MKPDPLTAIRCEVGVFCRSLRGVHCGLKYYFLSQPHRAPGYDPLIGQIAVRSLVGNCCPLAKVANFSQTSTTTTLSYGARLLLRILLRQYA